METLYRSQDGAVEVYRRADGQARLIIRKPTFEGEVRATSRDITDEEFNSMTDRRRAEALRREWEAALEAQVANYSPQADRLEQEAWDKLIDFIEASGLNYSDLDPRGGRT